MGKKFQNGDSGDEDENAWIFSYADMISLVLGFFIIMYSMSTIDDDKFKEFANAMKSEKVKEEISEAVVGVDNETRQLRALQLLVSALNLGQNMEDAVKKIEDIAEETADAQAAKEQLLEKVDENEMVKTFVMRGNKNSEVVVEIVLPNQALFLPGGDDLNPQAKSDLKKLAQALTDVTELVEVEIVGHTDSTLPSPRAKYTNNWSLSAARAGAVAHHMILSGLDKDVVKSAGQADLQPLFPEFSSDGKMLRANMAKNRRVNIVVKRRPNEE